MREDSEMGVVQTNLLGEESFSYFSIDVLKQTLWSGKTIEYMDVLEYVAAMTLLGNDFLPHSFSIKIRDDGHKFLVGELKNLLESGQRLLKQEDGLWKMNYESLHWLLKRWVSVEEGRVLHSFKKKIQMRGNTQMSEETLPLQNPVEFEIVQTQNKEWSLKQGWQSIYREKWLFCRDSSDLEKCCREYLVGLQWVIDYYTGQRDVDMTWFYPRLIPPLWQDIELYMSLGKPIPEPSLSSVDPIQPEEQLAMVLPLESWHHISPTSSLRSIPYDFPQYWPSKFGFFTAGRVWTWECEPLLPILPVQALRSK